MKYDITVVGGGIVGLATAHSILLKYPRTRLLLIEKESGPAAHQTGHNSGVIHSGLYYKPGSLKATLGRKGAASMAKFCAEQGIRHDVCGKVVVATHQGELPRLDALYSRGQENGIPVRRLTKEQLNEREPDVAGLAALEVPTAGIADYPGVCARLAQLITASGGEVRYNSKLEAVHNSTDQAELIVQGEAIATRCFITCAGLQSDLVAKASGAHPIAKIVPFRGEYYTLRPEARHLIHHLVYPLPNPAFPFLGVHFTRMVSGEIHAGPNAVLALKREGYTNRDFSLREVLELAGYSGFRKMASKHWREGLNEMHRSFSRSAFLHTLQRLVPALKDEDISPSPAGVRAMALMPNGDMVDDFLVVSGPHALHVCNAPSPAATAAFEIGEHIANLAGSEFDL